MNSLDPEDSGSRTPPRRGSASLRPSSMITDPPTVVTSNPSGASTHISDPSPMSDGVDRGDSGSYQDWMPKAGTRVGNYELGPPIGVGGMATVYVAQDLSLERTVALKILPPKSAQDTEVLQRFLLEGKAAARLDHPNIARIFALGHDGSFYFLAFEFVEGRTVRQWIDDVRRIEVSQALDWSIQTAMALAHADRRGVVHRDIKPSNLIVTPGGQVKLVDLGLARRYETQGQVDLTQSGTTLGTFDYISPEQARDPRNVDIRSDLYSLGCTMYHMLTGTPPFPGQNVVQKLLQHQEKSAPDIREINPDVPDSLADLIARLMSKSPADRPASAESCVREFETIRTELAERAAASNQNVEPNTLRGLLSWLVPATVLTGVITVGAWLASDPGRNDAARNDADNQATGPEVPVRSAPEVPESPPKPEPIVPRAIVAETGFRKPPTTYRVKDGASLAQALKESSPGSVIVLTEPGRYELRISELPILEKTDLTLRGETGIRPTIVAAIPGPDEPVANPPVTGLVRTRESRITIQNVTFDLSASTGSWLDSAIYAENSDLTLRDVLFLGDVSTNKTAGRFVRFGKSDFRDDSAWRPLRVENCRFLGNRAAISGRGSLDISIFDSAMLGSEPLVDIDETERETPWPCVIRIDHVNFQATAWTPVLELGNVAAALRVRNSVFAPKPGVQMILVSSRKPSRVDWFGRENLYGDMASFMESPRVEEEIVDFAAWSRSENSIREQSSLSTKRFVYWPVESVTLAMEGRWADAFAMNPGPWSETPVGVRAWSLAAGKTREVPSQTGANVAAIETKTDTGQERPARNGEVPENSELPLRTEPPVAAIASREPVEGSPIEPAPMPMPMQIEPDERAESKAAPAGGRAQNVANADTVKPPPFRKSAESELPRTVEANPKAADNRQRTGTVPDRPAENPAVEAADGVSNHAIRTAEEFVKALTEQGKPQGSTLTLAAGVVIKLDSLLTLGEGRWLISAEQGPVRPRIVFVGQNRALVENRARWTLEKAANLRLRGIDIDWDANESNGERLFDVATGTQVVLESCSLTSKLARPDLFLFAATHSQADDFDANSTARASVRLIDTFVRSSGGVLKCPAELRGDLELSGSLCVIGRPLVTTMAPERLEPSQSTRVQLNQSTLVLGASLATVHLGRTPLDRPQLEFQVRRSILAGNDRAESPLIEVQGGDPEDEVLDCVSWDGEEVAYHQWSTYRMDRNSISGMLARRQSREEWQLSHILQDHEPIHGDVDFSGGSFWAGGSKVWNAMPADFVIREGSPASGLGAKIDRLPRVNSQQVSRISSSDPDRTRP